MDLQALTVGVAVVSMGAWLASARTALLQDANATLDASRKLAVVNGLGEHSRAQARGRVPSSIIVIAKSAVTPGKFQGVPNGVAVGHQVALSPPSEAGLMLPHKLLQTSCPCGRVGGKDASMYLCFMEQFHGYCQHVA